MSVRIQPNPERSREAIEHSRKRAQKLVEDHFPLLLSETKQEIAKRFLEFTEQQNDKIIALSEELRKFRNSKLFREMAAEISKCKAEIAELKRDDKELADAVKKHVLEIAQLRDEKASLALINKKLLAKLRKAGVA